jgi:hypothetical protein
MSSVTFSTAVGGDGSTVTDDNNATTGLRDGGWKTRFVPCFTQQVAVANYVVNTALTVLGGATTNSTSTTSLAIGTGSKSLTLVESGKAYIVGQYVIIASTASPSNNMVGQITSFSGTSLVVNVTTINGSGTISAWSISVTSAGSYLALSGGTMTGAITFAAGQFGTNVNTFLTTPSSANLAAALTDETGSGAAVFATSPTLVTPVLGTPSSGTLSSCTVDGTNGVGYINIPQNSQSAAYTLVAADAGKHIFHPSTDANARTFTIPANSSVAYPIGTAISFVNMTSQVVSIAITTDTMYLAGTGTTGTRSLAQYGTATALKIESGKWIISGAGLT